VGRLSILSADVGVSSADRNMIFSFLPDEEPSTKVVVSWCACMHRRAILGFLSECLSDNVIIILKDAPVELPIYSIQL
jgi:hypothetical protein